MNTVSQAQLPVLKLENAPYPKKKKDQQANGSVDLVNLGSSSPAGGEVLSLPRKVLEGVGGAIGGALETAISAPAGFIGGMVESVDEKGGSTPFKIATVLELGTAGAIAGYTLGIWGAVGGGILGLILGGIRLGIHHASDADDQMIDKLEKSVKKAISNNVPTGKKARDTARNATEGAILGFIIEGKEGWKTGYQEGKGFVSGFIEGSKGIAGVITGKYGPAEPEDLDQDPDPAQNTSTFKKVGKAVLSVPKKIAELTAGLLCGTIGAAITLPVGLIQGIDMGTTKEYEDDQDGFYRFHRFMAVAEFTAAGGAAGFIYGGPVGLGIGLGAGLVTGIIVRRIEKKSGADKQICGNVSKTLVAVAKDNPKTDSKIHDVFRNTVEGGMVGTVAGVKEGFKKGFEGGIGAVDGFIEGIKGFFGAVSDINGKKK